MGNETTGRDGSTMFVPNGLGRAETETRRPWFGELPEVGGDSFSFAVVGDRCGMATEGVFESALDILKDLKPDFVVSVGDSIEGYWRDAADAHAEWDEFDAKVRAAGLPFFPVVGNHDYGNRVMADVWQARKGPTHYAFRFRETLFLMLNTEETPDELPDALVDVIKKVTADFKREPERAMDHLQAFHAEAAGALKPEQLKQLSKINLAFGEEQLDFVKRVLEDNADAARTFVTMHKPGWKSEREDYGKLLQLLGGRPYTMFAGHLHALEYEREGNRERIQMGRTGGLPHGDGAHDGDANMILWVTVRSGEPSYRVLPLDGVRAARAYPPKRERQAAAGRASE